MYRPWSANKYCVRHKKRDAPNITDDMQADVGKRNAASPVLVETVMAERAG